MSDNRPEIPANDARNVPLAADLREIAEINREFLQLLLNPHTATCRSALGLPAGLIEGLRRLDAAQLDTVASVPLLLAEVRVLPGTTDAHPAVEDCESLFTASSELWRQDLQGFVDRLLVFIWQSARRESGLATLCIGIDLPMRRKLAELTFADLSRYSRCASAVLQARFAGHRSFWPDLLASAYGNDPMRKTVARLAAIQLSVAAHSVPQHPMLKIACQ